MVATSASTEAIASIVPNPPASALPASYSATRPSLAPRRVANQAPSEMSHMAEVAAPVNTAAMILRGRVSYGR